MAQAIINDTTLTSIANAIRTKHDNVSTTYMPSQMSQAILDIPSELQYDVLCFTANTAGSTLYLTKSSGDIDINLQYSYNNKTWTNWSYSGSNFNTITLSNVGSKVYIRGNNSNISNSNTYYKFVMNGSISASGSIMSLLSYEANIVSLTNYVFARLFQNCTALTTAPVLPATTLANRCYYYMFNGCTNLTVAPVLPATTLADGCYYYMFNGCTNLTVAPVLPATTLIGGCYYYMFRGCTNLKTPPALPATTLTSYCYYGMFYGCTNLVATPVLPATTLASYCYAYMFLGCTNLKTPPVLPATTLSAACYDGMFYNCTNLTVAPVLPATTLADSCYSAMFQGCTNLASAPVLPATYLNAYCYYSMFYGCTNLKTPPALPATILGTYCYAYMFYNCTSITTAPTLPATYLNAYCYYYMFCGCTHITTVPPLPATTLANYCYAYMFKNCTSLVKAPILLAETIASYCYKEMFYGCSNLNYVETECLSPNTTDMNNWLYGVASTGTFIFSPLSPSWTISASGIPSGWTYSSVNCYVFKALEDNVSIGLKASSSSIAKTIEYSLDKGSTWQTFTSSTSNNYFCTLNTNKYVYIRGNNTGYADATNYNQFISTKKFMAGGKILALVNVDNMANYAFRKLFYNCSGLISITINFGTTYLTEHCCESMCANCLSLDTATATVRYTAPYCCKEMFKDCSALKTVGSRISAISPCADYAYYAMYENCDLSSSSSLALSGMSAETGTAGNYSFAYTFKNTKLTQVGVPIGESFGEGCCKEMYKGCSYATSWTSYKNTYVGSNGMTLGPYCFESMYEDCTSLQTSAFHYFSELSEGCCKAMYKNCTSMTRALPLFSKTLVTDCYKEMFYGCSNLTLVNAEFQNTPSDTYTKDWLYGVYQTGTFLKNAYATWSVTGTSGIPSGWTEYFGLRLLIDFNSVGIALKSYNNTSYDYSRTIQYSINGGTWTNGTSNSNGNPFCTTTEIYSYLLLKCSSPAGIGVSSSQYCTFTTNHNNCNIYASGNLTSLANSVTLFPFEYTFYKLFYNFTRLKFAPDIANVYELGSCALAYAFAGCTQLRIGPEFLPTENLTTECYSYMFQGCTLLKKSPILAGVDISTSYGTSFYSNMFNGCTALEDIKTYATSWNTNYTTDWVKNVASSGVFTKISSTSIPTGDNGIPTNWTINNIEAFTGLKLTANYMNVSIGMKCTDASVSRTIQYSLDNGETWNNFTSSTSDSYFCTLNTYQSVLIKGNNTSYATSTSAYNYFISTQPSQPDRYNEFYASGNVNSLINYSNNMSAYCFCGLFYNCTGLRSVPDLPATTLSNYCYAYMFYGCTKIKSSPRLPAETLSNYCYTYMFCGCTSLNYIETAAISWNAEYATNWVQNVAESGRFNKKIETSIPTGNNGIPTNWVIGNRWVLLYEKTTTGSGSFTPSQSYSKYGLFIVGGGGGGKGDKTSAMNSGNGGNGGVVLTQEVIISGTPTFTISVGSGGAGASQKNSYAGSNGTNSTVTVNGTTYTAAGGRGGIGSNGGSQTKVTGSGLGGTWVRDPRTADKKYKASAEDPSGALGEDGLPNPFSITDTNLYGAGGGGGINAYDYWNSTAAEIWLPGEGGGNTGGGSCGIGPNNNTNNHGGNATFYGGGGGGAAFSSGHTYSQGGNGYQGIVMIYGYIS